jgi:addiction module RelE/StbE family toxin
MYSIRASSAAPLHRIIGIAGFHDEALSGEWKGHRSSRLGAQYRVIYRVQSDDLMFQVISITAHDYRRPAVLVFPGWEVPVGTAA